MSIRTKGHSLRRFRTSSQSENASSFSLRRCSRMKPAGGRSSMRSFRTSSYVSPPTLYERRRAQVSLFTVIVVVGITIHIINSLPSRRSSHLEVIAPCPNGQPSPPTLFRLEYPLGLPNVRNYDGAWTEWGNL